MQKGYLWRQTARHLRDTAGVQKCHAISQKEITQATGVMEIPGRFRGRFRGRNTYFFAITTRSGCPGRSIRVKCCIECQPPSASGLQYDSPLL